MPPRSASMLSRGRVAALGAALEARGAHPEVTPGAGALVAALAASKPGGLALVAGPGELGLWIADAMHITTRLVALADPADAPAAALLRGDLRIAVHHQPLGAFLADIENHRFDLIALEGSAVRPEIAGRLLERTAAGGIFVAAGPERILEEMAAALEAERPVCTARVPGSSPLLVAGCGPPEPAPKRRGGRAGRRSRAAGNG